MILQLVPGSEPEVQEQLANELTALKFKVTPVSTQFHRYLVANGNPKVDIRVLGRLKGVADVFAVTDTYQLVSAKWKINPTTIDLGEGIKVGGGHFSVMAGPCSIEGEAQVEAIAKHLIENKVSIMRGGVFKPRSSPYSFRGMGLEGLKMFSGICRPLGIKIISEVMQVSQIAEMYPYIDIYQVGARNTQNFNLLDELGQVDKPVLLKRGISGSIDELLQSAEYVFSGGNERLMLCERGIRTFETASRNTLDLNAVPILKAKSHLPVIVDPSHGIGVREYVPTMALAAAMAGADGVIYETHPEPEKASSDGAQTLNFEESALLIRQLQQTAALRKSFGGLG